MGRRSCVKVIRIVVTVKQYALRCQEHGHLDVLLVPTRGTHTAVACCCLLLCAVACWSTGNSESRPRGDRGTRIVHSTLQKARGGKKKRQSQSTHISHSHDYIAELFDTSEECSFF